MENDTVSNLYEGCYTVNCDVILDTAKTVYAEESDRFKQAEAKANMFLAFSGVVFAAYIAFVSALKDLPSSPAHLIYGLSFKLMILSLLTIAIIFSLRAVTMGKFDQVSLDSIVTLESAKQPEVQLKLEIASTYKAVVDANRDKIESKMRYCRISLNFTILSLLIFSLYFIIEEVIKNVR